MRRSYLLISLIVLSFVSPLANFMPGVNTSHAQTKPNKPRFGKFADSLRERVQSARDNGNETARVILNLSDAADPQQLGQALSQSGARSQKHLDQLGLMVADVPLNKLEEAAARDDVSWISADQEVRSLSTDNTSHIEITTGATLDPEQRRVMADLGVSRVVVPPPALDADRIDAALERTMDAIRS